MVFAANFEILETRISAGDNIVLELEEIRENLSAVEIFARQRKQFSLERMQDVSGTAIYAGKKSEVVLVDQTLANLASNNARQIYSQVAGLNIFQNDDAGLQLNRGRGLDPNRSSNFNTRQTVRYQCRCFGLSRKLLHPSSGSNRADTDYPRCSILAVRNPVRRASEFYFKKAKSQ